MTEEAVQTITETQQRVLDYVREEYTGRGYGLTVREVANRFGWNSPNSASIHLKRLKAAGLVTWEPRSSRTIRPADAEVAT